MIKLPHLHSVLKYRSLKAYDLVVEICALLLGCSCECLGPMALEGSVASVLNNDRLNILLIGQYSPLTEN